MVKFSIAYPLFKWDEKHHEHLAKSQKEIMEKRVLFSNLVRERQKSKHFGLSEERRNEEYELFYQLVTNQEYEKNNCLPELEDTNILFVTLRYSKARELIEKVNKESKGSCWNRCSSQDSSKTQFPAEGVRVEKAPEPDEIKWENVGFPQAVKKCRKVLIYLLAVLLIGVTLATSIALGTF